MNGSVDPTDPAKVACVPLLCWHKAILTTAALLVCLYAVSVLYAAQLMPDIGLHCAFSCDVNRRDLDQLRPDGDQPLPRVKDSIIEMDGQPVLSWPQLLAALSNLRERAPTDTATHQRRDGEELVLVKLRRFDDGEVTSVWCLLDRSPLETLVPSVAWFFLKVGLFAVGLLVFWNRPSDRSAAVFFVLSIVTVGAFMGGYHWIRISPHPPLLLVFIVCAVILPAVSLHFYLVFPRPKLFLQRWPRATLLATYGLPVLFLAAMLLGYFQVRTLFQGHADSADLKRALDSLLNRIYIYFGVAPVWYLASVVCLLHSFRSAASDIERNQVKWILLGSLAALAPIGYSLYLAIWAPEDFGSGAATWPMFAASACLTLAFAVSITRYRLMQLDQIIGSSMVYVVISFLAGLVYYAVVFTGMLVTALLVGRRVEWGPSLPQALGVSTTALVLTLVLDLVRNRFKKAMDRRFRRDKVHLDRTLQRMGQALEQLVDPPTLARRLLQASADLLGVVRGSVYLREGNPPLYRLADSLGEPPPLTELASGCPLVDALQTRPALTTRLEQWAPLDPSQGQLRFLGGAVAQALVHEGHLLALLVLGPKDSGPYGTEDLNLLAAFAQITALALENAERHHTIEVLNRDLQAKVDKISEQQRRILALQSQLTKQAVLRAPSSAEEPGNGDNGQRTPDNGQRSADGIIGSGPLARQLLQQVRKVAASPSAVLLRGESGTGKGLLARALHDQSPRAGKAFVTVHCTALSAGLLESELFGHVKGAFTGAHRDKVGRFELANGGTLFLDEIGDISLEVQTKLLRVLQEKTFERVGSSEPVQVDVRVIAATHQDLEALIEQGRFRGDLFYRLNVISVTVPPLRERREDIAELAAHFLRIYAQRCGVAIAQIDDDALVALKGFSWPGNIRQLENVMERAVVMAEGTTITLAELPTELLSFEEHEKLATTAAKTRNGDEPKRGLQLERDGRDMREREQLVRALAAASGNKAEAARALGLARSTLLSRLKKHGLS
ncbi:MAG: sigma 54-interacting transcriptional regulator [Gemmataceae bacterium]|nr:sigma 54-interacting transcriptional regulator [Gemmataceae bacterium]